jgi:tetratricopeptide (TPR) repeat protein
MSSTRTAAVMVLAGSLLSSATVYALPQLPGSRAYIEARKGWDAIRDRHNADAAAAFAAALDADPRDPTHLGAGLAAHLLGQSTAAQQALDRALELEPSLTQASLLLGDILYRGSDIAGAIQVYEAARMYAPDDKALIVRLEALRREAAVHGDFLASHDAHFTLLFEGPADAAVANQVTTMLEAAYWRVSTALAVYPERTLTSSSTRRSSSATSPVRRSGRRPPTTGGSGCRFAGRMPISPNWNA